MVHEGQWTVRDYLDMSGPSVWAVIKTSCHLLKAAFSLRVLSPLWCSPLGGNGPEK